MRRLLLGVLLFAGPPAWAGDVVDRMRIPERRGTPGRPVYVASLAPMRTMLLPQVFPVGGGGGGSGITSGTTPITGGLDTAVCFDDAGVMNCGDAGFTFDKTTNILGPSSGTFGATLTDSITTIVDETDATKKLAFQVSGFTTGTTRTITIPNSSGTMASTSFAQTFSGTQTFSGNVTLQSTVTLFSSAYGAFYAVAALTPDAPAFGTGTAANSWHVFENADLSFDFQNGACGTSACTDPGFIIHSRNQDTQEYLHLSHDGGSGSIQAGNSTAKSYETRFGRTVALTEAGGAETVITVVNATTETFGLDLFYIVTATDATNRATRKGYLQLVCDNAATVMTCTKDATAETDDASILIATGGVTLTYAILADVATADTAKITFNIDSTMTVSAASIVWQATLFGAGTIQ